MRSVPGDPVSHQSLDTPAEPVTSACESEKCDPSVPPHDEPVIPCDLAQEALSARLDGEREPIASQRVDTHVRNCAACTQWWQHAVAQNTALHLISPAASALPPLEVPATSPSWRERLSQWRRWADTVDITPPQGAEYGRKTNHLHIVKEPPL